MPDEPRHGLLCVDLDGTLVATDTLDECLLCIARNPQKLLMVPVWLLGGKARFKERVAEAAAADLCSLPYRPSVCEYIKGQTGKVDEVVLATAANWRIAKHVAGDCEFIQNVLASDEDTNLSGERKLAAIAGIRGRPAFRLHRRSCERLVDLAGGPECDCRWEFGATGGKSGWS